MDNVTGAWDGKVWSITGYGLNRNVRTYDPGANTWTTVGTPPPFLGNYARSSCQAGSKVYMYGDTSTSGFTGLWSYDMATTTWAQETPSGTAPATTGIWAPAWAYDADTGYCYLTGGATVAGAGTLTTAYVYDPATNAWLAPLPNFTSARGFHATWVFTDNTARKLLCVAGGNNSTGDLSSTQCYDFVAGAWGAENADMGALPATLWGMGYSQKVHQGVPQLWTTGGVRADDLTAATSIFDVAANAWADDGDLAAGAVYRTSATTLDNEIYAVGGSIGSFSYTGLTNRHVQCPTCEPVSNVDFSWDPASPFVGDLVTFTGSAQGTPPLTYGWVFGDGGVASGNPADHTYVAAGDYDVTLAVSNACGQASAMHTVPVTELAASITLTKTVGTTPGVCAVTDEITVTAGTEVYYCYQVENTGDVTFNFHDLVDSELGVILNDLPYTLAPSAFSPQVIVPATPMASVTNVATWTAMIALGAYIADDTIPFDWQDISGTGTAVPLTDDSVSGALPIGFPFEFYGTAYSDVYASSNGFLSVLAGQGNGCCTGGILPSTTTPNGVIAGWWEDLNPSLGGAVHYQTLGAAPNRVFIVQYTDVPHFGGGNLVTKQYKLFETSNVIEVHYQAAPSDGGTHSAGIENATGTLGVQYYRGTLSLPTPLAVRYYLTTVESAFDSDSATVNVLTPNIDVNPLSLSETHLTPPQVTMKPITVTNTGQGDLVWNIAEEPAFVGGVSSGSTATPEAAPQALSVAGALAHGMQAVAPVYRSPEALINDGSFENGPPPASAWTEISNTSCEWIGNWSAAWGVAAFDGVNDFWGGGYCGGILTSSSVQQVITVPPTRTTLSFWYLSYRPDADDPELDYAYVEVNGSTVWTYNLTQANNTFPNWVNTTVDLSAYAGQTVTLKLGAVSAGASTGNIRFDYLEFVTIVCDNLVDVPWLSVSPTNGVNGGGTSTLGTVTFDSTLLADGVYTANLCVFSNDPDAGPGNETELVIVPVMLTVGDPTAVALSDISAAPAALPAAGVPLAALPAVIGLALGAAYALRRKQ